MLALVMRALFLLACVSLGYHFTAMLPEGTGLWGLLAGLAFGLVIIAIEILLSKTPIQSLSAIVFGLIVGCLLAILLYHIFLLAVTKETVNPLGLKMSYDEVKMRFLIALMAVSCYVCMMVIYKTRDRFRFIIPYVEFQKEEKGARPIMVDTSAVIDGRLAELCEANVFDTTLIVPKFVLQELQHVADSGDRLRRNRGRRGLEMLQRLQRDDRVSIQIHDGRSARGSTVDSKLVSLASQLQARVLTCDYNLTKFAELQNVDTINLSDLTNALRPTVLPGEELSLKIIRPGDEPGQGVGYLGDGTMVVVEQARDFVDRTISIVVTSTLQTSAGRMIFGRLRSESSTRSEDKEHPGRKSSRRS